MPYTISTVSVTSSTIPVSLMPPTDKSSWMIRVRSAAANSVLLFNYSGTLPGSAPGNSFELAAGQFINDQDAIGSYETDAMQQGWAAVLETGSTAVTVDSIYRT